mmetsp:Transcript_116917/g.330810  ORF Transcript_116917/g.330810 Transcript_116917/m.330810 type:complete len:222 (+) Transcript_116917:453-1118(+)
MTLRTTHLHKPALPLAMEKLIVTAARAKVVVAIGAAAVTRCVWGGTLAVHIADVADPPRSRTFDQLQRVALSTCGACTCRRAKEQPGRTRRTRDHDEWRSSRWRRKRRRRGDRQGAAAAARRRATPLRRPRQQNARRGSRCRRGMYLRPYHERWRRWRRCRLCVNAIAGAHRTSVCIAWRRCRLGGAKRIAASASPGYGSGAGCTSVDCRCLLWWPPAGSR